VTYARYLPRRFSFVSSKTQYLSVGLLTLFCFPSEARAQATDIKVKKPNALLLLDNSGSMAGALNGAYAYYYKGGTKTRWTILAETLTGSVNGLYVTSGGPFMESNDCRPYANLDNKILTSLNAAGFTGSASGASVAPFTWPTTHGNPKDRDAVAFCNPYGKTCTSQSTWSSGQLCRQLQPGETDNGKDFSQVADGLLDVYRDRIRFGVASFDTMDNIPDGNPGEHKQSSLRGRALGANGNVGCNAAIDPGGDCWGTVGCQNAIDGSQCLLRKIWRNDGAGDYRPSAPQWSYWHSAGAVDTWLNGGRGSYSTLSVLSQNSFAANEQFVDIGMRNSRAHPWRGRLIGFGPADWKLDDKRLSGVVDCIDEDSCTALHNEMVQQSVLGLSRYLESTTPLAALMRDAHDFILNDTTTHGIHLPHEYDADVTDFESLYGTIGPQTDPYFSSAASCRNTSVILVTDGEPWEDLDANMSKYADLLHDEGVNTFVIGVGMDSARWNPPGSATVADTITADCSKLTVADLGTGRMCQRDTIGGRRWKYADVAPWKNSPKITPGGIRACCNLLETAVLGGSSRAYFPKNQLELKQELNKVFGSISGGAVSRTVPVFGGVTASFTANAGSSGAPAVSYELRSSMDVSAGDSLWRGNLERVRYACDEDDAPVLQDLEVSAGDVFAENLTSTAVRPRKFFTVVPREGDEIEGSLRAPSVNAADGLFAGGNAGAFGRLGGGARDKPQEYATLAAATALVWPTGNNDAEHLFGLSSSELGVCKAELGAGSLSECSTRIIRWYAGDPNPDGGAIAATDPAPSRAPGSAQCSGDCSPLGAVYRSVPIFVPPPSESENDDQNFGKRRSTGTPSFVERYHSRPTMLYSQTIDGQLHAFVVAKNDYTVGGAFSSVPEADSLENNELWSFIPPAVMPRLWDNFNSHARLLDGQLAWGNVVYDRELGADAGDDPTKITSWEYQTVVVGCSGVSVGGSFCYALEVTDPTSPKFLWQLRSAGDAKGKVGAALFGDYVPGASIAHIRIRDGEREAVKAVAIIPGGSMARTPSDLTYRRAKDDLDSAWDKNVGRRPREIIRDWGTDALPARSLTFVELETGRILARMTGELADQPRLATQSNAETQLDDSVVVPHKNSKFDSPITGIPATFPSGARVAERVYVGDADGTLWRVELKGADPKAWEAHIAFDAFNIGSSGESTMSDAWVPAGEGKGAKLEDSVTVPHRKLAGLIGQPIQTAPLLSTDEQGDLVVTFATGDQESFNSLTPGMVNVLVSFRDTFNSEREDDDVEETAFQAIVDKESGVELAWRNGARVTGPLNLFDGQLYFAYFIPSESLACTYGTGGICGLHYLDKSEKGEPISTVNVNGDDPCNDFESGEVVFGLSVNLVPTCAVSETSFNDPWLAGGYKAMTESNPGRYELVFQTGQGGTEQNPNGGKTKRSKITLPQPQSRTTVRSFVRVAETEL
jgi:type IV pilus assembly protein PilY1